MRDLDEPDAHCLRGCGRTVLQTPRPSLLNEEMAAMAALAELLDSAHYA